MSMLLWRDEGLCDMMMGLGGFVLIHEYECDEILCENRPSQSRFDRPWWLKSMKHRSIHVNEIEISP